MKPPGRRKVLKKEDVSWRRQGRKAVYIPLSRAPDGHCWQTGTGSPPQKAESLSIILDSHSDLALCYAMKEEMCSLFDLRDPDKARRRWTQWFEGAKASGIPALIRFAELKEKRIEGLVAHARHNISTGKLEGFNNKIKVAKRIGYGYRDEDYFFTLIRYMSIPAVRFQSPRKT